MLTLTWRDRFQIYILSSCSDMTFPLTLYVPSTLGFLKAARYIAVILPVVIAENHAKALQSLVDAALIGLALCACSSCRTGM